MNQNITEYKNELNEFQMYYCKASIRNGYYIVNGDEGFYHFIGKNSCYSIPELLHPEDVEVFLEAAGKLKERPQRLLARIRSDGDQYIYVYMVLRLNGRLFGGFHSFDIEICDIMAITERYVECVELLEKYHEFLAMFPGMFLEYDFATDIVKVYEYRNNRKKSILHEELESIYARIQEDGRLSNAQKAEFRVLYEAARNGSDRIKAGLDAKVFHERSENIRYECKLHTTYKEDIRDKVVGLVFVTSEKKPKKRYYLTEEAYDAGTGLLNKRAIHEYALEKMQEEAKGVYLAIMDVDDFKKINDGFGHMFGDEVLAKVSEVIRSVLKSRGVAGRFGGDEFMIVFEGIDTQETLCRILETIARHVGWAFSEVEGLSVTMSMGISKYPEDGTAYEELFRKADKCLYVAKAEGKNRFVLYNEDRHNAVVNEEATDRWIGLKANISDAEKYTVISELMLKLHDEGKSALHFTMEQMQVYFDIDGVALYVGKEMARVDSVGKYMNPVQNLTCIYEEAYQEYFDEQGVYMEDHIQRLENKAPAAYHMYAQQEVKEMIQCAVMAGNGPLAVVSFDFFNRAPKLGKTDKGLIKIAGRMMAQIIADEWGLL